MVFSKICCASLFDDPMTIGTQALRLADGMEAGWRSLEYCLKIILGVVFIEKNKMGPLKFSVEKSNLFEILPVTLYVRDKQNNAKG